MCVDTVPLVYIYAVFDQVKRFACCHQATTFVFHMVVRLEAVFFHFAPAVVPGCNVYVLVVSPFHSKRDGHVVRAQVAVLRRWEAIMPICHLAIVVCDFKAVHRQRGVRRAREGVVAKAATARYFRASYFLPSAVFVVFENETDRRFSRGRLLAFLVIGLMRRFVPIFNKVTVRAVAFTTRRDLYF